MFVRFVNVSFEDSFERHFPSYIARYFDLGTRSFVFNHVDGETDVSQLHQSFQSNCQIRIHIDQQDHLKIRLESLKTIADLLLSQICKIVVYNNLIKFFKKIGAGTDKKTEISFHLA